jgi:signal transduction histidine kinase/DNA-binding response OmpR family regulator
MSIRTKIALVLVGAVVVPIAASMVFWTWTLRQLVDPEISLFRGRQQRESVIGKSLAESMAKRGGAATALVAATVKQLNHDVGELGSHLERLRCARPTPPPACEDAARAFLARHEGDLEGVRFRVGETTRDVVRADVVGERAAATAATLTSLEREPGDVALRPAALDAGWLMVTRRSTALGPITVWGTLDRLRDEVDRISGRSLQIGLVGPDGQLLYPLSFRPRGGVGFELTELQPRKDRSAGDELRRWFEASGDRPVDIDGRHFALRYAAVPGAGIGTVTLSLLDAGMQSRFIDAMQSYLLLGLGLIAVAFVGSALLASRLTGRLRRLRTAADQIGAGRLDTEVRVEGRDEVGRLAERFRAMAYQLREHINTLEQRVDERTRDLRLKAEELARANDDLVRLTKLKSDFLARMSHELRTPLNSIIGFSDLMLAEGCGPLNGEQRDALERVNRNGANLLQLINDILDISKIEADRLTLKFGSVSLRAVVDNALGTLMLRANDKKIALTAAVDPDLPMLYTDEIRLLQILTNLLSNAVKFTEQGGVTLTARATDGDRVVIAVQDTGIGINAEDVPKLFTEFYQADSSRTRRYEGTGLGLAITKRLVEALGGTVSVQSELGVGSTFTAVLPVVATDGQAERTPRQAPAAAGARAGGEGERTILVIDDDPETHLLVTENLKPVHARLLSASTGAAGIVLARREHPDLILLDVRLPDRQGWEVLHDLKVDAATADIPVIVVSVIDRESLGFSLGAADYLVKPVNWDQLFKVLGRLGIVPEGGEILVVDDDVETRQLMRRTLEAKGFTVAEATDGRQALALARERRPSLMLLDLIMPVMDGFDTLNHLREDPRTADLPVVVLTAKDLTDDDRDRLGGKVQALFQKQRVPLDQLVTEVRSIIWQRPVQ